MGYKFCVFFLLLVTSTSHGFAADQEASDLYANYKDRIVQVRVVDLEAEEKSALGTGFLVSEDGLVATNFHVISELVNRPDKFRLEYKNQQGDKGKLELLDIDIINDLALLSADPFGLEPLEVAIRPPAQGDTIYSIGNPYDIGFTVVPGTYNGIADDSFYKRIHFSGSVNAGMSGGPVLNAAGEVVGINVSSAGNQLSFLVPVAALQTLISNLAGQTTAITDFDERIRAQLSENQRRLIGGVLQEQWPTQKLGQATALDELPNYVKCWGGSADDKALYKSVSSSCRSNEQIYLGPRLSTGIISYQFFWLEADKLNTAQFNNYYQALFPNYMPDNSADEDSVTNYSCDEEFVDDSVGRVDKLVLCVRAYRKYADLYDVLYVRGSVDEADKAFISHFTLAGVERNMLTAFMARFEQVVSR